MRSFKTSVTIGQWDPKMAALNLQTLIKEQRMKIMAMEDCGEEDIAQLKDLIKQQQILKNEKWEIKKERSTEVEEMRKRKPALQGSLHSSSQSESAGNTGGAEQHKERAQQKIKQLQEELRKEMEEHLLNGKMRINQNQERLIRIQHLKEEIGREQMVQNYSRRMRPNGDAKEEGLGCHARDMEMEYAESVKRLSRLKDQHTQLIQGELKKMEEELKEENIGGASMESYKLRREQEILLLQLEALQLERNEAEESLKTNHRQHVQVLNRQRAHSLQVFRAFRELTEKQKEVLTQRYHSLLLESIQDAVHLSARNQQLQLENLELQRELRQVKSAKKVSKSCHQPDGNASVD
ncbi:trichohyalin [Erpetoichthys calabaricus]|uniref:trichohyalin n=1 Tax=Erpetoichthys calabaricus TaxID=27687 RepID=UPI00223453F4|nr:trichohyalin [Erpetoichthys calabaricus]